MDSIDDVDFSQLSPTQFEELCFDLLVERGYQKLVWRQGGADSGRDIQGTREVESGLVNPFEETWFFECKRYEAGVPPEALNSKIAWADAERPNHLVFMIASYISNNARTWVEAIARNKFYQIHLIEGKQLKTLVSLSPRLMERYFLSDIQELMRQAQRAWVVHNLIPEPQLIRTLAETDNLLQYTPPQLAFLWSAMKIRFDELNQNMEDSWGDSYDHFFGILKHHANTTKPVVVASEHWSLIEEQLGTAAHDLVYNNIYAVQVGHVVNQVESIALYSLVRDSEGEGLEVIVYQNSSLSTKIRHISSGARKVLANVQKIFRGK